MAIIHYEHFDLYGTDLNALLARGYSGIDFPEIVTEARTGNHCLGLFSNRDRRLDWSLPAPLDQVGQGCAIRYEGVPGASGFEQAVAGLRFGIAGNASRVRVQGNPGFGISVFIDETFVGRSANAVLSQGAYAWLEALVVNGAGSGSVEVRLNGAPILTLTGLQLPHQWASVSLGQENTFPLPTRWDDWVVWDRTGGVNDNFIGDTFVIVAAPNADGTPSDFVPSTGTSRWDLIDEVIPDDADFISGGQVGAVNEFAHVASNLPIGSVAAIATQVRAFKTDAGASSLEVGLSSGGQASMSGEMALGTGALVRSHIANLNPNGNVPWTQAAAQAAKLRLRRAA